MPDISFASHFSRHNWLGIYINVFFRFPHSTPFCALHLNLSFTSGNTFGLNFQYFLSAPFWLLIIGVTPLIEWKFRSEKLELSDLKPGLHSSQGRVIKEHFLEIWRLRFEGWCDKVLSFWPRIIYSMIIQLVRLRHRLVSIPIIRLWRHRLFGDLTCLFITFTPAITTIRIKRIICPVPYDVAFTLLRANFDGNSP